MTSRTLQECIRMACLAKIKVCFQISKTILSRDQYFSLGIPWEICYTTTFLLPLSRGIDMLFTVNESRLNTRCPNWIMLPKTLSCGLSGLALLKKAILHKIVHLEAESEWSILQSTGNLKKQKNDPSCRSCLASTN